MKIGVPKEIKNHEYRVGMTPAAVHELCGHGHSVCVEMNAGAAIGFTDDDYTRAGAEILDSGTAVFEAADMIVKVKEPQAEERALLKSGQTLFTYLHLAPDQAQTDDRKWRGEWRFRLVPTAWKNPLAVGAYFWAVYRV